MECSFSPLSFPQMLTMTSVVVNDNVNVLGHGLEGQVLGPSLEGMSWLLVLRHRSLLISHPFSIPQFTAVTSSPLCSLLFHLPSVLDHSDPL